MQSWNSTTWIFAYQTPSSHLYCQYFTVVIFMQTAVGEFTCIPLNSHCNSMQSIAAWVNPVALTFPSRCGESNLPDSVAAVGGSPPDDISCCEPGVGGQPAPRGVIKMPEKSSLTPATESIVLIKGELWLSADKSRRRGGVREKERQRGKRKELAGVLGVRGNSLVMLTKSRHSVASFNCFPFAWDAYSSNLFPWIQTI